MKKHILMLGMILLPTLAMAATPDFSGSWVRNAAGSDPIPNQMYWMTRAGNAMGGGGRNPEVVLNVHQNGKTLTVADSQSPQRNYVLDGAAHTRKTDTGIQKATETSTLQADNSVVVETTEPFGGMPGNIELKMKAVWTLSADGKTLTIVTTRDIPARVQTYKEVYTWRPPTPDMLCSAGCVAAPAAR